MALHLQRRVGVTGAAHPDSQPHTSYLGPAAGSEAELAYAGELGSSAAPS